MFSMPFYKQRNTTYADSSFITRSCLLTASTICSVRRLSFSLVLPRRRHHPLTSSPTVIILLGENTSKSSDLHLFATRQLRKPYHRPEDGMEVDNRRGASSGPSPGITGEAAISSSLNMEMVRRAGIAAQQRRFRGRKTAAQREKERAVQRAATRQRVVWRAASTVVVVALAVGATWALIVWWSWRR